MKQILTLILLAALPLGMRGEATPKPAEVKALMKRVADWQIANPAEDGKRNELDWTQAALYVGMADWAELAERTDQDDTYYKWLLRIGRRHQWQPGARMYHADDIAVSAVWLDLYRKYGERSMWLPTLARTEFVVRHPSDGTLELSYSRAVTLERWSWCDALFMAPPVYAKMYRLTGDRRFIDFMNEEYRATCDFLYDREEHLFYRDWRYFDQREANGSKVFWGRGNAWVIAGLCEVLQELPPSNRHRAYYEALYLELAKRLAELQSPDGYWHASLLDPASYPSPETSATGFITYALAYGVNKGLLDRDAYLPVVLKGWQALTDAVEPDGKLGYVQPIGADPKKVPREMTAVYGVGAFLLTGCQVYQLLTAQKA